MNICEYLCVWVCAPHAKICARIANWKNRSASQQCERGWLYKLGAGQSLVKRKCWILPLACECLCHGKKRAREKLHEGCLLDAHWFFYAWKLVMLACSFVPGVYLCGCVLYGLSSLANGSSCVPVEKLINFLDSTELMGFMRWKWLEGFFLRWAIFLMICWNSEKCGEDVLRRSLYLVHKLTELWKKSISHVNWMTEVFSWILRMVRDCLKNSWKI